MEDSSGRDSSSWSLLEDLLAVMGEYTPPILKASLELMRVVMLAMLSIMNLPQILRSLTLSFLLIAPNSAYSVGSSDDSGTSGGEPSIPKLRQDSQTASPRSAGTPSVLSGPSTNDSVLGANPNRSVLNDSGSAAGSTQGQLDFNASTYVMNSGDRVQIQIFGAMADNYLSTVNADGDLIIPRIGAFKAAGFTFENVRDRLLTRMRKLFRNVDFSITLSAPRTFKVFVLGEVASPQAVQVTPILRLSEIIQMAGGAKPSGSLQRVRVKSPREEREFDLKRFFREGDLSQNPTLVEGENVVIPVRGDTVYIGGGVEYSGSYELSDKLKTLDQVVALASPLKYPFPESAKLTIQRKSPTGEEEEIEMSLVELKSKAPLFALRTGDIIRFPYTSAALAPVETDKIYISGEIRVPGAQSYNPQLSVQDYIGMSGGLTARANFKSAKVVKKNGVSFDLGSQVRLEPGDTIFIPEVTFKFWQDHIAIITALLGIFSSTVAVIQLSK